MHGKILLVDAIATNRILLRVKLAANHYDTAQADSLAEAMRAVTKSLPDMILCADVLPDGGPMRLMARLRKAGLAGKVPVIVLSSNDTQEQRLRLLAGGAEDVLQKTVNDQMLLARTRSVIRAYASASEWTLRDGTSRALGFAEPSAQFGPVQNVRIVSYDPKCIDLWRTAGKTMCGARMTTCLPSKAVINETAKDAPDAFVLVVEPGTGGDMLGLLATIRSHAATRHSAILVVLVETDDRLGAQMLDMGANDLMEFDRDPAELALRLKAQLARKHMSDALRDTVRSGIEAAVIDPLTGLHNRRYAMPHLARIADRAYKTAKPFAVMVADMDHFKRINDTFGHAAGDAVLIETATRLRENLRAVDLVARIGGEEFLIVMPGVGPANAKKAAQRLCRVIRCRGFEIPGRKDPISTTLSVGMTVFDPAQAPKQDVTHSPELLLDRADKALYGAKAQGRDRVTLSRPAA
jgi:two-component system, cell cycle response regulator